MDVSESIRFLEGMVERAQSDLNEARSRQSKLQRELWNAERSLAAARKAERQVAAGCKKRTNYRTGRVCANCFFATKLASVYFCTVEEAPPDGLDEQVVFDWQNDELGCDLEANDWLNENRVPEYGLCDQWVKA